MSEPGKGAFNNPAPGQKLEILLVIRTQDDRETKATVSENPIEQLPSIAAVDPDFA